MNDLSPSPWPAGQSPAAGLCDDGERLTVLTSFGLDRLDEDQELASIARFAARLCDTPIALVSIVEEHRQRFLAGLGLEAKETPRDHSFCAHAMLGDRTMVVEDASTHPTFETNPLVTGEPHIRFYAGAPLISSEGAPLGSLCVIDSEPRPGGLSVLQQEGLEVLATSVMRRLESQRQGQRGAEVKTDGVERLNLFADSIADLAFIAHADGSFEYVNSRWIEYLGVSNDFLPNADFLHIHEDDREAAKVKWADAIKAQEGLETEFRYRRHDGAFRWMLARVSPYVGLSGQLDCWFGTLTDIDDSKKANEQRLARIQQLIDSVPSIAWAADPGPVFTSFNARWHQVTGGEAPQQVEDWRSFIHPDDWDASVAKFGAAVASAEPFEDQWRLRQADGTWRWVLSRAVPSDDDPAKAHWFGTITDIDDSYREAERREILAKELAHRIKNIFAVMAGLITLRSRSRPEAKEFADELTETVRALGRAQDFVMPLRAEKGDSLRSLLDILTAPYGNGSDRQVHVSGDTVKIGFRAATPMALIFHELATNAAKYGALSVDDGRIEVHLVTGDDSVTITWKENGGPEVRPPEGSGFGSRLLQMSVQSQLNGAIEHDWASDGLQVRLTLPIASLAD